GHGRHSFGRCVSPVIKKFWRDSGWFGLRRGDRHRLRRAKRGGWCLNSIAYLYLGFVCFSFRVDPCRWSHCYLRGLTSTARLYLGFVCFSFRVDPYRWSHCYLRGLTSIAHLYLGFVCFSFRVDPCRWSYCYLRGSDLRDFGSPFQLKSAGRLHDHVGGSLFVGSLAG